MIGDIIELKENHLAIGKEIFEILNTELPLKSKHKLTIGIAGESGSGKSVTAFALQKILNENDIKSMVWQMDDYFKIPPKSNHENRLKSIENVGMQEVDLVKLSENISEFKNGKTVIEKPLVHYKENRIANEKIDAADYKVLIVEGTYILEIDDFDFKIFIDRNYKDTYENRMSRNRDEKSDFVENVLEIEHQIIKQFKAKSDLVLGKNYELLLK
ncbi:MAG: hypothetical protein E2590_01605 [Chryseobacterium sp.]|nr:hypothetical protein [Chryseobacterium sp.]